MPQPPAVTLSEEERTTLETFVHRGKANARTITRARILLKSAQGWSTAELAAALDVCEATVTNVRGRFARGGLEGPCTTRCSSTGAMPSPAYRAPT
jgi:DNA-directed RNA polymerase specialized sigma24 family protein